MGYSIWVSKESDTTERLLLSLPRLSKHIEDGKGLIKKCYHIFPEAFLVAFLSSRAVDSGGGGEKKRKSFLSGNGPFQISCTENLRKPLRNTNEASLCLSIRDHF